MTGARAEILSRVAAALGPDRAVVPVPRDYRGSGQIAVADPLALLAERLRDYRAHVHRCARDDVAETIAAVLAHRGATDLAVPAGFPSDWLPAGLAPDRTPRTVAELDRCHGALTTCRIAIATTGTIVLDCGPGQGARTQTLVPDYHFVVVRSDQVVVAVPDALSRLDPRAPLTWISGPSATSDIELNRVEGVHGPRTLEVIVAG